MDKNKNMNKSTNTNPTLQLGFWQICPKIGIGAMSTSVGQARQGQNWCSLSTNVSNYKCVFFCNQTTICVEDSATNEASQYYLDVMTNRFFDPLYHHVAGWFRNPEWRWWNFRNHWITFKLWPSLKIQSADDGMLDEILMLTSSQCECILPDNPN